MTNIGWQMKLTKMWHRALASYLRAVVTVLGTLSLGDATDQIDISRLSAIGMSLLGAVIAPLIVFITEAANLLDEAGDKGVEGPPEG